MEKTEKISFSFPNQVIRSIAVASFQLVQGIRVLYKWSFNDNEIDSSKSFDLNDIFKIILCNVHHQDEKYYSNIRISKLELTQFGLFIVNSIFIVKTKRNNAHYSLGIIMNASEIPSNLYINEILNNQVQNLSTLLKDIIIQSKPFSNLTNQLKIFADGLSQILSATNSHQIYDVPLSGLKPDIKSNPTSEIQLKSMVSSSAKAAPLEIPSHTIFGKKKSVKNDFSEVDSSFLAILLTSHFQTQMATVIECKDGTEAHCVSSFLDCFLLPAQREMSSLEILRNPIPGLFLQCVQKQKTVRNKLLVPFNKLVTWANLSDHSVEQIFPSNVIDSQNLNDNSKSYNQSRIVKSPCPWACRTVAFAIQTPTDAQVAICKSQMDNLIRAAIAYSMYGEILQPQPQIQKSFMGMILGDQTELPLTKEFFAQFHLSNDEDLKIVSTIAQLFNHVPINLSSE